MKSSRDALKRVKHEQPQTDDEVGDKFRQIGQDKSSQSSKNQSKNEPENVSDEASINHGWDPFADGMYDHFDPDNQ